VTGTADGIAARAVEPSLFPYLAVLSNAMRFCENPAVAVKKSVKSVDAQW
jgi:hypothetical protein